uniref:Uncharacterized protein n=1 Tax=Manihot esculenta TaxID=3983 RepID=A0A2C9UM23_MANES
MVSSVCSPPLPVRFGALTVIFVGSPPCTDLLLSSQDYRLLLLLLTRLSLGFFYFSKCMRLMLDFINRGSNKVW